MFQIDYERFFNLSFDLLCVIGPTHVKEVNTAFTEKLGYSREELLAHPWVEFVHPEDRLKSLTSFGKPGVRTYVNRFMTKNGDVIWLEWTSRYVEDEGVAYEAARDITERKTHEAQLARTVRDLKRSNQELERFAYVASHDLQEPLRMVSNYMELLEEEMPEVLTDDARTYLHFAKDGAQRMRQLITDLLAYSRVGRNASMSTVELEASVLEAIKLLNGFVEKNASLEVGKLPKVWGDTRMLTRVFMNLISNAVKFRKEQEPLVIRIDAAPGDRDWETHLTA